MGDLDEHATFEADRAFLTTPGPDAEKVRAAIAAYLAAVKVREIRADWPTPTEPDLPSLQWALDFARTYWQWGNEAQVQAALTVLAQHIAKEPEEHYDRYAHRDGWCVPVLRTGVDDG